MVCDCSVGQAGVEIDLETKLHIFNSAAQLAMGELKGAEIVLFLSSHQDLLSLVFQVLQLEKRKGKGEKGRKEAWGEKLGWDCWRGEGLSASHRSAR